MMCDHSGVYTNESTQGDQTLFVVEHGKTYAVDLLVRVLAQQWVLRGLLSPTLLCKYVSDKIS